MNTPETNATATAIVRAIKLEVSKTVEKAGGVKVREKVGEVSVYSPTLADFGMAVEPVSQDAQTGELTYAEPASQWLYNALLGAVKANARNKMQTGSTDLKANNKFASTLEELITPAETGSVVLAERRGLIDMFKGYLGELAKPENVKKLLLNFLEKPDTLALQPAEQRAKIKAYFDTFGGQVEDKLTAWQGDYLLNVIAQCEAEEVEF